LNEIVVSLELLEPLDLLFDIFLTFSILLLLRLFLQFLLKLGLLLLMFDQVFDHTRFAEDMTLEAGHGFNQEVIADGAHLESLDGVLTNACLVGAVLSFEFLPLLVGEDSRVGVVFGMLAHLF
jgi:hypothetical protein